MSAIVLKVARDYSKSVGGRYASNGPFSGEDFRQHKLLPAYIEAIRMHQTLVVDLDGGFGYPTSFLEESFGGLARATRDNCLLTIVIKSEEEPALINQIRNYIKRGLEE